MLLSFPNPAGNVSPELLSNNLKSWQVGQILNAIVEQKISPRDWHIKIGSSSFTATTTDTLKSGELLKLKVLENNDQIILQQLKPDTNKILPRSVENLLRQALPKQQPLASTLSKLLAINENTSQESHLKPTTSAPLFRQVSQLKSLLMEPQQLGNSQNLKAAIKNSGVFLESTLLQQKGASHSVSNSDSTPSIKMDMKGQLLQLLSIIDKMQMASVKTSAVANFAEQKISMSHQSGNTSSPIKISNENPAQKFDLPHLKQLTESALARIQFNQSQSVSTDNRESLVWRFEIPVIDKKHVENIDVQIHQEKPNAQTDIDSEIYSVDLCISTVNLGKIHAELLIRENELNVSLWTEKESTAKLVADNLPGLEQGLTKTGLKINSVTMRVDSNQHIHGNIVRTPLIQVSI